MWRGIFTLYLRRNLFLISETQRRRVSVDLFQCEGGFDLFLPSAEERFLSGFSAVLLKLAVNERLLESKLQKLCVVYIELFT